MKTTVLVAVTAALALTACSPVFNWREVGLGDSGLIALLPCKPDRATREVVLGGDNVTLQMAGCETGGATFTLAYAVARDATQATVWLSAWKMTMTNRLQAQAPVETAAEVHGAQAIPPAIQLKAAGDDASGHKPSAQFWWFAQKAITGRSGEVVLYQATVLGQPTEDNAATTFFESLRLP